LAAVTYTIEFFSKVYGTAAFLFIQIENIFLLKINELDVFKRANGCAFWNVRKKICKKLQMPGTLRPLTVVNTHCLPKISFPQ
jgi:hypothetical protein